MSAPAATAHGSPAAAPGRQIAAWWQAAPFTLVFALFFLIPLALILMVSFWDFNEYELLPGFTFKNYVTIFDGCFAGGGEDLCVTLKTYLSTLKFSFLVWLITLVLGFAVSYFLAFHVRSSGMQTALFVLCTIPFWTSNVIRMISWVPLLGRNGLVNQGLQGIGLVDQPVEWLLFSDFSVTLAFVHLYTMFMIVPIFNSMMRIDRSLLEAASDSGASAWQTLWNVIVPLCKTGIIIGSIFVITIVMGDFVTIGVMGGQQIASVGKIIQVQTSYLQFPLAAANAVILLAVVLMIIWALTRLVDIRKELLMQSRISDARPSGFWPLALVFALFVLFMYGPMLVIVVLSFQGPEGGLTFPIRGLSLHWFRQLAEGLGVVDIGAALRRSLAVGAAVMVLTVVLSVLAGLAFRKKLRGGNALFYIVVASLIMPSIIVSLGIGLEFRLLDTGIKWLLTALGMESTLENYGTALGLFTSALGAHLTWTLPFGLLIMFAVFNRFNPAYEEAARDLGATPWQGFSQVVLPLIAPSVVGIGMFGFTLSWDEIARTSQAIGDVNTLPLELQGLTSTVTTPAIYALGTVTTVVSFLVMGLAIGLALLLARRRKG